MRTGRVAVAAAAALAVTAGTWAAPAQAAGGAVRRAAEASPGAVCAGSSVAPPPFFTDRVQQPPTAAMDGPHHYTLTAAVHDTHRFASSWRPSKTLAYSTRNAPMDFFGPTVVTREGVPVDVTLVNRLPPSGTRIFPTFPTTNDENMINLHHHGGLQEPDSDGVPAPLGKEVLPGRTFTYHFPNQQAAAPLFYHDHDDMNTGVHVYPGLVGYSPQTDSREKAFGLPDGGFAKVYSLLSASFDSHEQLCYSKWGDMPVVNGTIAPREQLEPRRYTFTFINESSARFFHLSLRQESGSSDCPPPMTVVASDQGYLRHPVPVSDFLLSPGERYKVVVDFTGRQDQRWILANDAVAPYPGGGGGVPIPQLMRFDVGSHLSSPDRSRIPGTIDESNNQLPLSAKLAAARLRVVQAAEPTSGNPMLGDASQPLNYDAPATETPQVGSWEVWAIGNTSPDTHPIHLHLIDQPQLIGRWRVGKWTAAGKPVPGTVGPFEPAEAYQSGPKDVFNADPGYITAWVAKFPVKGTTVWHCHMATHEDGTNSGGTIEMMRPLVIGDKRPKHLPYVHSLSWLDTLVHRL